MSDKKKLSAKELTRVGALGAVLIIIRFAVMALGGISSYVWIFGSHIIMDIAIAPVFFLILEKVHKNGPFIIINVICGIIFFAATWMLPIGLVIGGMLSELCIKKDDFKGGIGTFFGFFFFNLGMIAEFFPLFITQESYLKYVAKTQSKAYAEMLSGLLTPQIFILLFVFEFVGSLIGYFIGRSMMKKHFSRADAF